MAKQGKRGEEEMGVRTLNEEFDGLVDRCDRLARDLEKHGLRRSAKMARAVAKEARWEVGQVSEGRPRR